MKYILVCILSSFLLLGCSMTNEEKIDELFSEYNKPGMPGAAVMVIKDGEILIQKGYGLADIEKKELVTEETNFRLASVTKQFTAIGILLLIEDGKLELTTNLKDVFPDFPDYGSDITIKNLLQHTSGLIDYEDLISDTTTEQLKDKDVLALIIKTDSTYFQPGSQHKYSNTGYALLALIIERVSGKHFRDFLRENIFNPLGMDNTIAYEKNINEVKQRAFGYDIKNGITEFSDQSITSAVLGDGGIYSSLSDLYKWDQVLYTSKLIDKKYLNESFTKGRTTSEEEFPYGYGWRLETYKDLEVVFHTGSTRGFRNIIYRIPEKKFTIVILTNRNSESEFSTLEPAHRIVDIYF